MNINLRTNAGGVGEFYPPRSGHGFGLKVVRLLDKDGHRNRNFWNEAKSIHRYCAQVRFLAGTMKIPLAVRYYLRGDDPLWRDCWRSERESAITEVFRASFVKIDHEQLNRYRGYEPVSEELLRQIFEQDLDADLLMVYPMAYGGEKNLTSYYHEPFSAGEARALICQISAAILNLYRCETAHGDIKPENIMVSEINGKKLFRLTDFGSAHFEDAPSDSGTNVFYDRALYKKMRDKTGSNLIARVYTDFSALERTVLALALGYLPDQFILVNEDIVTERWPEIREQWEMLQDLDRRTLDDFRKLAAEGPDAVNPEWKPFHSYCDEFDSIVRVKDTLEYGRLHEQITFSDQYDPLMRVRGIKTDREIWKLFPEFCHTPLTVSSYGVIFHAPDDSRTGKPPRNFRDYIPCDLNHIRLTAEESERLTGYGKKLNEYFLGHPYARVCLPLKEDIFRCCGALKMIWGKHIHWLDRPVDYEAYFRYLTTEQADFSVDDWLTLLPHLPELQYKLDRETCLKLLDRYSRNSRCDWLFGIETFQKHISGEEFIFSPGQWLKVCGHTSRFDDRINAETAWKMFKAAFGTDAKELLEKHPRIAELLHSPPSPETDNALRIKDFLNLRKWDRDTFLSYFPDGRRADLTQKQWEKCLHVNPSLIELVPEELLPRLSRKTWVRILGTEPGLIGKCPCADRFSAAEWGSILLQQPQLKKYCPAEIVFSDRIQKRIDKKTDFFFEKQENSAVRDR